MAKVRCNYEKMVCSDTQDIYTGDCHSCTWFNPNEECPSLELRQCFVEKTSKNVEFEGENLYIGGKFIAAVDDFISERAVAGDTAIHFLNIDGEVIIECGKEAADGQNRNA